MVTWNLVLYRRAWGGGGRKAPGARGVSRTDRESKGFCRPIFKIPPTSGISRKSPPRQRSHQSTKECLRDVHAASKPPFLNNYVGGWPARLCDVRAIREVDAIRRFLGRAGAGSWPRFAHFILHFNSVNMPLCQNRDKEPVFVSVCEAVNGPDGEIPSVIRLYLVNNECEEVQTGSVYVSLSQCALKFFDGFVDRKFYPFRKPPKKWSRQVSAPLKVEKSF